MWHNLARGHFFNVIARFEEKRAQRKYMEEYFKSFLRP